MTELNKLFSSLILLGGGFFAASLVGPPEVIDRLSRYLQPSGLDSAEGLRPLAVNTPASGDAWAAPAPTAPPQGMSNQMASVAAMVPAGSWPGDAPTPNVAPASPWGAPAPSPSGPVSSNGPASLDAPAPSQDWLTSQNLVAPALQASETSAASRPLTPVERGGVVAPAAEPAFVAPAAAEPQAPVSDGWPELRAPLPPMAQQESQPAFAPLAPQQVSAAKPVLEANPYEARPRFDAASTGFDDAQNPLRYQASAGQSFDPIQRQPAPAETFVQHIVTDGDTLPSIAQRYLGDASRAQELFELNRDRLQHPDVLPIGMVLKTPKNRAAQSPAPTVGAAGVSYPRQERPSDFSTVSATEAYLPPLATAQRRPLTPIGSASDRPLTDEERLGPVDALYQKEFAWDANGW